MMYKIKIKNTLNIDKIFYISADSQSALYRRVMSMYGMEKERVTILEEYEEVGFDGYELKKSHVGKVSSKEQKLIDRAKELFAKQVRKAGDYKEEYKQKHGMTEVPITCEQDVVELLKKYKKVKVCWQPGNKRGIHEYFALVK